MGKVRDFIERLESLTEKVQWDKLTAIIKKHEKELLALNKGQLFSGQDSEGKKLSRYKSTSYAEFKKNLNPQGVTDLYLTGSFYENFFVASELPIIIWSYDEKTDSLVKKYGRNIFGLTNKDQSDFIRKIVLPEFIAWQREVLHLR